MTYLIVAIVALVLLWVVLKSICEGFTTSKPKSTDRKAFFKEPGDPDKCWMNVGQEITVNGFKIPDGMIYVGEHLAAVDSYVGDEPALINPELSVRSKGLDKKGQSFSYWPAYHKIPAKARKTYLTWLAEGRSDPDIAIGYVFLFFY